MDWVSGRGATVDGGGRGHGKVMSIRGGASIWRGLGAKWCQCGGKHQHFGLHEGEIGQSCDHFGRLLAQILLFPRFPVKQEEMPGVRDQRNHICCLIINNSNQIIKSNSWRLKMTPSPQISSAASCWPFVGRRSALWPLTWWRCWFSPWWTSGGRRHLPPDCWSCRGPAWLSWARTARGRHLNGRQKERSRRQKQSKLHLNKIHSARGSRSLCGSSSVLLFYLFSFVHTYGYRLSPPKEGSDWTRTWAAMLHGTWHKPAPQQRPN